ncbi:MAG: acyl-CoA reductase [Chitinophagales bacterium]
MILQQRINDLCRLGDYMLSDDPAWVETKKKASLENRWFIPEFIELAAKNIAEHFLAKGELEQWAKNYRLPSGVKDLKAIGIVMAGNIPMVGFHDLLSVFISGHKAMIKTSSKDEVLIRHLVNVLINWDIEISNLINFSEMLKNCDAYIATGSNNTSRYFDYYFGKYPNIIRRNKTSVGVLSGKEKKRELEKLADDVCQFFGLGCRNVTKIYVPAGYDFKPLLMAFEKYNYLADHHKYKNNYDYNLTVHILNNKFYMTNGSLLLVEETPVFSPISQLNYEYYTNEDLVLSSLSDNPEIQCIVGYSGIPFGQAQSPGLFDYADRVDTMAFLRSL